MNASRNVLAVLLIAGLTFVLGMSAGPSAAADDADAVGTYFFESVTQSTGQALNGFITLNKGGTLTWADMSDFGAAGVFNSTTHGVWKLTGSNEVTATGYYYQFDPAGTALALIRITTVGSIATGIGTGTVDVFGPTQNPVTEPPLMANADTLAITSTRVKP